MTNNRKNEAADAEHPQVPLSQQDDHLRGLVEASSGWYYWEQDEHYRFVLHTGAPIGSEWTGDAGILGKTLWELSFDNGSEIDWQTHRTQLEWRAIFRDLEFRCVDRAGGLRWVRELGGLPGHACAGPQPVRRPVRRFGAQNVHGVLRRGRRGVARRRRGPAPALHR